MSRFFTSDLHIRHDLVVRARGYQNKTLNEVDHDRYEMHLAYNWDNVVKADDWVYVLGDIAMNPAKGAFDFLDARPGVKILISGNHDATAPFHSKAPQAQRKWLDHFHSIHDSLQVKLTDGRRVLLSHYPYTGEGERVQEDRHTQWRLRDEGMPLLHGHTHDTRTPENGHQFHVGLDAHALQLVPESRIHTWLDSLDLVQ
jgi:calcineurin-like phosphoesterase family protein